MTAKGIPESLALAVDQSLAWIEFSSDGLIISCNHNFSELLGYPSAELIGQHHRIFVGPEDAHSRDYLQFWEGLNRGVALTAQYKRFRKDGTHVWLQASYVPISIDGTVTTVTKIASDITEFKQLSLENEAKMRAIQSTMSIIEFSPEGQIISANDVFLRATGYAMEEIKGRHHRMFVSKLEQDSHAYKGFWQALAQGQFCRGEFRRQGKQGQIIDLEACYQPIADDSGKVIKVIKFAYDVTAQKQTVRDELQASAVQRDQALMEASMELERRIELDAVLEEVSTPITPLWDKLLMLPLVGLIDSKRCEKIMDKVLADVGSTGARELIIDISGVAVVDTDTAGRLISIIKAVSLMGCQTAISGISPQIAKTMTLLGINMTGIRTTGTLMDAIIGAYERLDLTLSKCS